MPGEHLYAHNGIEDLVLKVIDRSNANKPTVREGFWTYRLNTFVPKRLNLRDSFSLQLCRWDINMAYFSATCS